MTADVHNWPDFFKLEIDQTKLQGPARSGYLEHIFVNWKNFEQFQETCIVSPFSLLIVQIY